ncbi:dual specificity protein kinase TTK [Bombina bombina]|uniref:dual specificity protein kinase TTK n=1 Tax=Bombina bombina TaxID=8345 RepID=UPI00235B0F5E|nr:dual specificity protein kinase TTK [Bombina bombina]
MEEEDISERKLKIASILDRVKSFKTKYGLEDNWTDELTFTKSSADTTEHSGFFGHLVTEKTPEEWQIYLIKLENTGLPQSDRALLGKLIDNYSQAVESLPADQHSNNESYAKILVRFAELKALIDPDEARDQFQFARLNCKKYAFVHTSFAQFELSEGNYKKSKQILQKAIDCRAVPIKMLELALKNLNLKKQQLISLEEKENLSESNEEPAGYQSCILGNSQTTRNGSPEDVSVHINFLEGEKFSSPEESYGIGSKPLKTTTCPFGRVPLHSVTPPDIISDDSSTSSNAKRKPLTSINVTNFPSFSKPKEARDENQYSFGNVKFPVNHSPTNMEQSTEDSLEMNHFNRTSSTLTVKGNQDVHTFDQDTPVPQINFQENNTPFKPEPKVMADTKQPDPPKPNSAEKEWRWKVPETPNDIFSSEGRRMSLEPLSKPVSRCVQGPSLRKCDPVPECKTPVHKPKEDYMDCFRTPVMKKEVGPMSTPYDRLSDCGQPQTPANLFLRPGSFPILYDQCSSSNGLDLSSIGKPANENPWTLK